MSGLRAIPLDPHHLAPDRLTTAEVSRYERFRSAERASAEAKAPDLDEMIEVVLRARDRIEASVHAAEAAYGAPFDPREVRKCVVLQRAAEFLGVIWQHKEEVRAILRPSSAKQRRRP